MGNTWDIKAEMEDCVTVDPETGLVLGIDEERLAALQMQFEEKVEGAALWVKNLEAENNAISVEVKNLQERMRINKNKIEGLKKYLAEALNNGDRFKTPRVAIGWRKSVQVIIDPLAKIPKAYQRIKVEADKTAIKQALQAGKKVRGASLEEKNNLQIK